MPRSDCADAGVVRVWSDEDDEIIAGDLTAGLGYVTPAGGAVLTPISPFGLRDRQASTIGFTTSLGFRRKLDRIKENPRVALAFHAREHGFATQPRFVLLQGTATFDDRADPVALAETVWPAMTRFMGPPRTGLFWDRWLRAHYSDRVVVTVCAERVVSWPDLACAGRPTVVGTPFSPEDPRPQAPPNRGSGPRVDAVRAARRLHGLPHTLVAYPGVDGFPLIVPVRPGDANQSGITLAGPLAAGGRRAGLLGHSFKQHAIGLEVRQYTGWLQNGVYAPHTESGFRAPANKTMTLFAIGLMARRGIKRANGAGSDRKTEVN